MSNVSRESARTHGARHDATSHLERRWNGPVIVSYAQNAEDVRLWRVFGAKEPGFYVDVGAGDPVRDSVTKTFYDAGWRGINVEPGPKYERLRAARPDDVNLAVAISRRAGEAQLWVSSPDPGLSSLIRLRDELVPDGYTLTRHAIRTVRLDEVLAQHARDREIGFLKIDTEGFEHDVLSSFDPGVVRPTVIVIESVAPLENRPTHEQWEGLLLDRGYLFAAFDGINRFYVPVEHEELIPALDYPISVLDRFVLHDAGRCRASAADDETLQRFPGLWATEQDAAALAEARASREELADIRGSISWRVTRPLRAIRRIQLAHASRTRRGPATERMDSSRLEAALADRLVQASQLLEGTPAGLSDEGALCSVHEALTRFENALASTPTATKALAWLSLAAVDCSYPSERDVDSIARLLRTSGARTLTHVLMRRFTAAVERGTATPTRLDIVRDCVIVDAESIVTSDIHTGIQRVARETISRWIQAHPTLRLAYFDGRIGALKLLSEGELERIRRWDAHMAESGAPISLRRPEEASGNTLIPWASRLIVTEILDRPHSHALRTLANARIHRSLSFICYDLIPIVAPETVDPGLAEAFCDYLSAVKRADRVSAISRQSALGVRAFSTMVSGEGLPGPEVAAHPLPADVPEPAESDIESGLAALELGRDPVVLVVGAHFPRKNHLAVLEASERLWKSGMTFELLLIGGLGSPEPEFTGYVRHLKSEGRPVRIKPRASEAELWAAYRAARFTVYPSLLEGFGLPVAESLASGTPVITSRYGCLAEVAAGGGAVLVDPRDIDDLTEQMRRLLTDDDLWERLCSEASARLPGSWDDYARDVWNFLTGDAPASR